jgi:hypothetical protein
MNEYSERDLGETRTRRAMLATAGGLLLPAGLLALDEEDAEATKRAKRRRRRRQPAMIANDTVINFRNATNETVGFQFVANSKRFRRLTLAPGTESGFGAGVEPWGLTMLAQLKIRLPGTPPDGEYCDYSVKCQNFEYQTPEVKIVWYGSSSGAVRVIRDWAPMGEDTKIENTSLNYRFEVHRWTNGKEPLDDYDEWYTRFYVTMSNV